MRRVGEELGVEAMSLYNHVTNKAEILDGIFETVLAELPEAKKSASWQAALRERARGLRRVLRAHPNALPIFATRPAVTPASITHVEAALDVLRTQGFSATDALRTFQVMAAFVIGHTVATYSATKPDEESHPAYGTLSEEAFPRVREMARILASHDGEKEFEFGVEVMIEGVEARLARKQRRKR